MSLTLDRKVDVEYYVSEMTYKFNVLKS